MPQSAGPRELERNDLELNDPSLPDLLVWSFWFFIWITALAIWFRCLLDMFGDHTLGGWGKAGRALVPSFRPWLGASIDPIARSRSMDERQIARAPEARAAQERYIQQVAGPTGRPRRADPQPQEAA